MVIKIEENTNRLDLLHLSEKYLEILGDKEIICLVDGEHYPPVTKATLDVLKEKGAVIKALVFLGGTEKIEDPIKELHEENDDYKIYEGKEKKRLFQIEKSIKEHGPDIVLDLSDEPIVNYEDRFQIASLVLKHGASYLGSDFLFEAPDEKNVLGKPSISIIGTGKRIGKTGVSVSIARTMNGNNFDPVIVCMGRGGPPEPVLVDSSEEEINAGKLIELAEGGKHAASDHLEDALLAQVPTIGCRRCGGGMAGNPFSSTVTEGAKMTNGLPQDIVIMEGSGSTAPPISTEVRITLIGANQPIDHILKYFGQYRIQISDFVIVTMCEEPMASDEKVSEIKNGIEKIDSDLDYILTKFRPEPSEDISGKKVFIASTAPPGILDTIEGYIEKNYDCKIIGKTPNLSNRKELRKDLKEGLTDADVLLTEIKAASIDVAGITARDNDVDIAFMHNEIVPIGGNVENLEEKIISLCKKAERKKE